MSFGPLPIKGVFIFLSFDDVLSKGFLFPNFGVRGVTTFALIFQPPALCFVSFPTHVIFQQIFLAYYLSAFILHLLHLLKLFIALAIFMNRTAVLCHNYTL